MERPRTFKDQEKLNQMLNLRVQGYSKGFLAFVFGCQNKQAINYQCEKYGVFPWEKEGVNILQAVNRLNRDFLKENIEKEKHWKHIEGEKINLGKTYAEYLLASKNPVIKLKS